MLLKNYNNWYNLITCENFSNYIIRKGIRTRKNNKDNRKSNITAIGNNKYINNTVE